MEKQINGKRPSHTQINFGEAIDSQKLMVWMEQQINPSDRDMLIILDKICEDILQFLSMGIPVTIAGIGTFKLCISWDGSLRLDYQPDFKAFDNINTMEVVQNE